MKYHAGDNSSLFSVCRGIHLHKPHKETHRYSYCGASITLWYEWYHMKSDASKITYHWALCEIGFTFSHCIKKHMMLHSVENSYQCALCGKWLISWNNKQWHINKKNIFHIRQQYRSRFGLQDFAGNYRNDKRFLKTGGLCLCLESREDEFHLLSGRCKVYGDLTEGFSDLTDDEDLVQFFAAVLSRRDQLDKLQ